MTQSKINQSIKIISSAFLYFSGILALWRRYFPREGVLILGYHRISDNNDDPFDMAIDPESLQVHLLYLKRHYHIITLDKAVAVLRNGQSLPRNTVVLTFDDGYFDNYTLVFPILQKYHIPATIFLTVDPIDKRSVLWFDKVKWLVFKTLKSKLIFNSDHKVNCAFNLRTHSEKKRTIYQIVSYAKRMNENQREKLISQLAEDLGVDGDSEISCEMLNWSQVSEMRASGIDFGGHTLTHPNLTTISPENAWNEVSSSKIRIEQKLEKKVVHFAYPNGMEGDFNDQIEQLVRQAGYQSASTLVEGLNTEANVFRLRRHCISSQYVGPTAFFTKMIFAAEMSGIFDFLLLRKHRI